MEWMDALRPVDGGPDEDLEPASFPETVADARAVIGDAATAWAVQQAKRICEVRVSSGRPEDRWQAGGVDRRSCEAALLAVLVVLRTGQLRTQALAEEVEAVRAAVRRGVRVEAAIGTIWFSHTAAQNALFEVLNQQLPPGELVDQLRVLSDRMFVFVDELTRSATALYERERAAWENRLTEMQRRDVQHILEHGTAPEGSEQLLGIRLAGYHLAAVVRPADQVPQSDWDGGVVRYASAVASTARAASSLVLGWPDGSTVVVWSFSTLHEDPVAVVTDRVPHPAHSVVALGPVGAHVAGLQSSLHGARQAAQVAAHQREAGVWSYDDVALQALLLADPQAAGRFVRHMLKGLTGTDPKSETLRETLWAYLRHGRSRLATAEELHVAPNTVAYRVHQADERLARAPSADPTALIVALCLARDFPALLG